jgi:Family of unknown function (DUF6375)
MKIWLNYGSEHSANLVMIGKFASIQDARAANALMQKLIDQAREDEQNGLIEPRGETDRFSEAMGKLLSDANLYTLAPSELEQFNYDFNLDVQGSSVVVKTDEIDVSALLKLLLSKGARVEVYSAHDYPEAKEE